MRMLPPRSFMYSRNDIPVRLFSHFVYRNIVSALAYLTECWVFLTISCMSPVRRGETLPIHNRIAVLRAERSLTRAELAALVNVNPQTVGALERGDHYPSLDLAFRICDVFGLPVEAVFSRTPFG